MIVTIPPPGRCADTMDTLADFTMASAARVAAVMPMVSTKPRALPRNLLTALSLNACPYRATCVLHRRPLGFWFYWGDNYSDAGEEYSVQFLSDFDNDKIRVPA
jgi:hypothetical protein